MCDISYLREKRFHTFIKNRQKVPFCCLVVFIQAKLLRHLLDGVGSDVRYPAINHQVQQIDDKFRVFTEVFVDINTFGLKFILVYLPAHPVHHLPG